MTRVETVLGIALRACVISILLVLIVPPWLRAQSTVPAPELCKSINGTTVDCEPLLTFQGEPITGTMVRDDYAADVKDGKIVGAWGKGEMPAFHRLKTLGQLATTRWTHVCVTGPVVYVRSQEDGDTHVTLDDGQHKAVLETIPAIPLARPKKGQRIEACGISRIDKGHRTKQYPNGWPEVHPVLKWSVAK